MVDVDVVSAETRSTPEQSTDQSTASNPAGIADLAALHRGGIVSSPLAARPISIGADRLRGYRNLVINYLLHFSHSHSYEYYPLSLEVDI